MKQLAYLVNQYPAISHTFVRREIQALEGLGYEIARYSIRDTQDQVISDEDRQEADQTVVVLRWQHCLAAVVWLLLRHPRRFCQALATLRVLWRNAGGGIVRHTAYFVEAAHLTCALQRRNIEHLHVHFGTNSTTVAWLAHRLGGPPFSFTVHGPEEFDRPQQESLGLKIRAAAFIVAISSYGRSQLQRWCAFDQWTKIHIVHCGLDEANFEQPLVPVADVTQFVCVGRLCEQKGHFVLVQAVRELAETTAADFRVVLVGDGDFRADLERQIAAWKLQPRFQFTGWQTEDEVQQWLQASRCLVLPSFAEGLPVVLMESLAAGRPVISTFVAGIPELVEPPSNGWLVPAGDAEKLAIAMKSALDTPIERLTRMGQNGRDRVAQQHRAATEARVLRDAIEQA